MNARGQSDRNGYALTTPLQVLSHFNALIGITFSLKGKRRGQSDRNGYALTGYPALGGVVWDEAIETSQPGKTIKQKTIELTTEEE